MESQGETTIHGHTNECRNVPVYTADMSLKIHKMNPKTALKNTKPWLTISQVNIQTRSNTKS